MTTLLASACLALAAFILGVRFGLSRGRAAERLEWLTREARQAPWQRRARIRAVNGGRERGPFSKEAS